MDISVYDGGSLASICCCCRFKSSTVLLNSLISLFREEWLEEGAELEVAVDPLFARLLLRPALELGVAVSTRRLRDLLFELVSEVLVFSTKRTVVAGGTKLASSAGGLL